MNRITNAIERRTLDLNNRLQQGTLTQDTINSTSEALNMDWEEHAKFQELKSLAHIEGRLTTEEAMSLYALLGGTVEHYNKQSLATKAVLTVVFTELLSKHHLHEVKAA